MCRKNPAPRCSNCMETKMRQLKARQNPSIRPFHPSRHGLLTLRGRRKQWSDGPVKLAPLKEEKML